MFKNYLVIFFTLLYILASAFLDSEEGGRVALSEFVLLFIVLVWLFSALMNKRSWSSSIHLWALPLIFVFLLGGVFSQYPDRASIELASLLVGFVGSYAIANLFLNSPQTVFDDFCRFYVVAIAALAFICLIDFLFYPGLISSRNLGGLQGPFRNTGQAGSYFGVHLAIAASLVLGGVVPRKFFYFSCVAIIFLALACTLKRAALVGTVLGFGFLVVRMLFSRSVVDKRRAIWAIVVASIAGFATIVLFAWSLENVGGVQWRLESKFSENSVPDFFGGFFLENVRSALHALSDSPLIGVGLGNVYNIYQSHEIHSTYFGVLAYSGLLGVVCYALFMFNFLRVVLIGGKDKLSFGYSAALYYLFPFVLGLIVSWSYTYHLRKREFWILIMFSLVFYGISRREANERDFYN